MAIWLNKRYIRLIRFALKLINKEHLVLAKYNEVLFVDDLKIQSHSKLIDEEHLSLGSYNKAPPHRFWYLLVTAVATVALSTLVFPTLAPGSQTAADSRRAQNAGLVAMSSTQLAQNVRKGVTPVYWVGPISGSMYAPKCQTPNVKTVTYLPNGQSDISVFGTPLVMVLTFSDIHTYRLNRPLDAQNNTSTGIDSHGNTYSYDGSFMNSEKIVLKDLPQVIEIDFPSRQSASTMAENADKLSLIL